MDGGFIPRGETRHPWMGEKGNERETRHPSIFGGTRHPSIGGNKTPIHFWGNKTRGKQDTHPFLGEQDTHPLAREGNPGHPRNPGHPPNRPRGGPQSQSATRRIQDTHRSEPPPPPSPSRHPAASAGADWGTSAVPLRRGFYGCLSLPFLSVPIASPRGEVGRSTRPPVSHAFSLAPPASPRSFPRPRHGVPSRSSPPPPNPSPAPIEPR